MLGAAAGFLKQVLVMLIGGGKFPVGRFNFNYQAGETGNLGISGDSEKGW